MVLKSFVNFLKENRAFFVFLLLMSVFRSGIADWNVVPSGSMKPTIVEGDRILVNKLAYDVQVPFLYYSLKKLGDPKRGDIIVFDSKVADLRLVKRVIGLPGDAVEMIDNVLYINGQELQYHLLETHQNQLYEQEDLLGVVHIVRLNRSGSRLSSFEQAEVPEGFYLALGDNRDNSSDSRVIGFVPRDEIIGRAKKVVMSVDYENYYIPRWDRFWKTL
jgi:signal peptidase I